MLEFLFFKNYLLSPRSGALVRMIARLSMVGVCLGVAALILVLSVMSGFNRTIRGRMFVVEPHIVSYLQGSLTWDKSSLDIEKLGAFANDIESIFPFESRDMIVRSQEGAFAGSIAKGYPVEAIDSLLKRIWRAGAKSTPEPVLPTAQLAANEIIVGSELARTLNVYDGDQVILVPPEALLAPKGEMPKFQKYTIKAVIASQMPEVDGSLLLYALPQNLDEAKKISVSGERGFEIRLKNPYQFSAITEDIQKKGFRVESWRERNTPLFFALKMEKLAMTLFLSLAVLITSFSIVTVMALILSQKRKDIGMLMAMGLSAGSTKFMFLRVGLLLGACGILGGIILGSGLSVLLHYFPLEVLPDIYQDTSLPVDPSWSIILGVFGGASILAILGAWLPVIRFKNVTASTNLRAR